MFVTSSIRLPFLIVGAVFKALFRPKPKTLKTQDPKSSNDDTTQIVKPVEKISVKVAAVEKENEDAGKALMERL